MGGVGARPARIAGVAAAREQGERTGGEGRVAELERVLQPRLYRARGAVSPAGTRQEQLERREPAIGIAGKKTRDQQLAVHQAASGTTRTPRLPRWRVRMR